MTAETTLEAWAHVLEIDTAAGRCTGTIHFPRAHQGLLRGSASGRTVAVAADWYSKETRYTLDVRSYDVTPTGLALRWSRTLHRGWTTTGLVPLEHLEAIVLGGARPPECWVVSAP